MHIICKIPLRIRWLLERQKGKKTGGERREVCRALAHVRRKIASICAPAVLLCLKQAAASHSPKPRAVAYLNIEANVVAFACISLNAKHGAGNSSEPSARWYTCILRTTLSIPAT